MALEQSFTRMTFNAQRLTFVLQEATGAKPDELQALALKRAFPSIKDEIIKNLNAAITRVPAEYDYGFYADNLRKAFIQEGIIQVVNGRIDLDMGARAIAGDDDDFYEGVNAARAKLKTSTEAPLSKRAQFWKVAVYGSARGGALTPEQEKKSKSKDRKSRDTSDLYDKTIVERGRVWRRKAPYWIFLEFGTKTKYAFPTFSGTHFLRTAQRQAQKIFDRALKDATDQSKNILIQEYNKFIANPDAYTPREVLAEFYAEGRRHIAYITPTRKFGARLR